MTDGTVLVAQDRLEEYDEENFLISEHVPL
jgi:hypothetical protein